MIASQDWDPCPLHLCSQSSQMLSHRIVFFLWSSSWSLGRHHKHLCRDLCNCTCRHGLFLTYPLPDKTLFSQAGFEDCVCLKIASGRHTHIFCYKLCTMCTVYRILILQYVSLWDCLFGIIIAIHGAGLCANMIPDPKFHFGTIIKQHRFQPVAV